MESPATLNREQGLEASRQRMTIFGRAAEAVHLSGLLPSGVTHKSSLTTDVVNSHDRSTLTRVKNIAGLTQAAGFALTVSGLWPVGVPAYAAGRIVDATVEAMARRRLPAPSPRI